MSQHVTRRIRVLVKAFPQPSTKYEETVCCAGVCEDTGELLRLFPIRYRQLDEANRFDRYDLVEMTVTKASDPRPESFRVDEGSIRLIERGKALSDPQKVKLWQPFIAPSLTALEADNKATGRSLGIIRPDPESLVFKAKPVAEADEDEQEVTNLVYQQASLLEDPLTPLAKPEFQFGYSFNSGGHQHWRTIQDWEVQAAYLAYLRRYRTKEKALEMMTQAYGQNMPTRNLHFIMGTMMKRPWQFILIGLLRSGLDPEELGKQGDLF